MTKGRKTKKRINLINSAKYFLTLIGKPPYLVLEKSIIGLILLLSIIGKVTRLSVVKTKATFITLKKKIKIPKIKVKEASRKKKKKVKRINLVKHFSPIIQKIKSILEPIPAKIQRLRLKKSKKKKAKILLKNYRVWARRGIIGFVFLLFIFSFALFLAIFHNLPSPTELKTRQQDISTKIYDRNGVLLYKIYKDKNRTPVGLNEIPLHVRYATIAAEDAEFYSHPGFSLRGITRSMFKNATEGKLSGGSTITQQLVKNALLSPEKTLVRKIREIILSIETEVVYSKHEILEMYLNEVSYGGTAYGIQEASQQYFGKDVSKLTLGEASLLAGLPKSPTRFSPFGANPEYAKERQKEVLRLMKINKFITEADEKNALEEELKFKPDKTEIKAPHFVIYVRQILAEKYGEELVEQGGLEVVTTLDYEIQKIAEEAVKQEVAKLSRLNVGNGAAVVLDPKTGEILAMVGSKDYFAQDEDGNVNVTVRPRQPGSSIKVVNYAYALSNGMTLATIIPDTQASFAVPGQPLYVPKNYDNKFRGKITLRSALAESRNIPAVKILASYGVNKMIELGRQMGITTWQDPSRYGLSLTLGGGEVKLIELAQVFATIANEGKKPELIAVKQITDYKSRVLFESEQKSTQVLDPRVAFQITDILKDNSARTPAFGSNSALVVRGHPEIAVKTGTSNDLKDNLTVGFSQKYLVAVWVGNNDGRPMSRIASGVTGAAPIWNRIMTTLLREEKSEEWKVPEGLLRMPICSLTGTLPCEGCPTKMEWFLKENLPKLYCSRETIERLRQERERREEGEIDPEAANTGI